VGRPFFHVTRCADSVGGGFSTTYGVSEACQGPRALVARARRARTQGRSVVDAAGSGPRQAVSAAGWGGPSACVSESSTCTACQGAHISPQHTHTHTHTRMHAWPQVILCHNRLATYKEVELAVAHELVHAYDFCRASNLDLTNCRHHACTEVCGLRRGARTACALGARRTAECRAPGATHRTPRARAECAPPCSRAPARVRLLPPRRFARLRCRATATGGGSLGAAICQSRWWGSTSAACGGARC
jgi:hypothetical protein